MIQDLRLIPVLNVLVQRLGRRRLFVQWSAIFLRFGQQLVQVKLVVDYDIQRHALIFTHRR